MSDDYHGEAEENAPMSGVTPPPREMLELDHVFAALAHPRRRYLCYTLLESAEWSLRNLARKIAAWEADVPTDAVTDDQRDRVYVALYHTHVPKLVDEGIVEFDESSETIRASEHAAQVLAALEGMGATLAADHEAHARSEMDDPEA